MLCRKRRLRPALFVALFVLFPSITGARGFRNMIPGEVRIRVQVSEPESLKVITPGASMMNESRRITGTFQAVREQSIVIRDRRNVDWMVSIPAVTKLEVSEGRHSHTGRGALIGLLAGGAGGVASAYIVCANGNCESSGVDNETEIVAFALGVGGAVAGAGFGALIGSLLHTERWNETPPGQLRLGFIPSREGGVQLALAVHLP